MKVAAPRVAAVLPKKMRPRHENLLGEAETRPVETTSYGHRFFWKAGQALRSVPNEVRLRHRGPE